MSGEVARRGTTLIEVLGAVLVLVLLGSMVAGAILDRLEFLGRDERHAEVRLLAAALEARLEAALAEGSASIPWRFEGVADRIEVPTTGTARFPRPMPFPDPSAPVWRVYPCGRPERERAADVVHEAGGRWRVVPPVGGAPEPDPSAPGWDANANGVVDRPDAAGGSGGERTLVYALEVEAGSPRRFRIEIFEGFAVRAGEVEGGRRLEERRVER